MMIGNGRLEDNFTNPSLPYWTMELPLGKSAETFRLDKAVCSHGLFMMAPNNWDPQSNTLTRALRLNLVDECSLSSPPSSPYDSVLVSISQPPERPHSLSIRTYGRQSLTKIHQKNLLVQVSRMLRLSDTEEKAVREFGNVYNNFNQGDDEERSFAGRVFRSPTLFEDMVKCILLCNCQWSRTLSMAEALCELQLELQHKSSSHNLVAKVTNALTEISKGGTDDFIPKTPAGKESSRKLRPSHYFPESNSLENPSELESNTNLSMDCVPLSTKISNPKFLSDDASSDACQNWEFAEAQNEMCLTDSFEHYSNGFIRNFPSPRELANLEESFLASRCRLGYRAGRILKLARGVVEGRVQLRQLELEENSSDGCVSSYEKLVEQLSEIEGFGPFTRANVLMCMGYYHVIPADSETIRHLKQVRGRKSSTQTMHNDVEEIYGKYAPYQFLAYWSELWHFYEKRFGKLSKMHPSEYKLITASNMRSEGRSRSKRKKII